MANVAVIGGSNRRMIWWIIIGIIVIVIAVVICQYIDRVLYIDSYQEVHLQKITDTILDMSDRKTPYWLSITSQESAENNSKNYNWDLPDIDFEKEMLIISYGTELKSLKYNLRESTFKTRGKYIGFPHFSNEKSENVVFVYRTDIIPLMDTDVAGYPPSYRGKY